MKTMLNVFEKLVGEDCPIIQSAFPAEIIEEQLPGKVAIGTDEGDRKFISFTTVSGVVRTVYQEQKDSQKWLEVGSEKTPSPTEIAKAVFWGM